MNDENDDPIVFIDDVYATGLWLGRAIGLVVLFVTCYHLWEIWK